MTPSNGAERLQLLGRLEVAIERLSVEFCELNIAHWGKQKRVGGGESPMFEYLAQDRDAERALIGLALEIERLRFTRSCVFAGVLPVNGQQSSANSAP